MIAVAGHLLGATIDPSGRSATVSTSATAPGQSATVAASASHPRAGGSRAAIDVLLATAEALVAKGKGILAADETVPTLTRRFEPLGIPSTEGSRRTYREMLFTASGVAEFISGVIMQDETIRQTGSSGAPLAQVLANQGIVPGIKVDTGAKPLAGWPSEMVTEGLD